MGSGHPAAHASPRAHSPGAGGRVGGVGAPAAGPPRLLRARPAPPPRTPASRAARRCEPAAPPRPEMWHSVGLILLVVVAALLIVLLLIVCGWYFVWLFFLSKFKFLRELVGDPGSQEGDRAPPGPEIEEDLSSVPHRIGSARQRRAPADAGRPPQPSSSVSE